MTAEIDLSAYRVSKSSLIIYLSTIAPLRFGQLLAIPFSKPATMKLTNVLALAAYSVRFAAANYSTAGVCLSSYDANTLATNFGRLVSAYSQKLANQTLISDFVDYSESINTLVDGGTAAPRSLLGLSFTSRADFETQSAAQPSVPFQVKNIWYNCNVITVRWLSAQSPQPVSIPAHRG